MLPRAKIANYSLNKYGLFIRSSSINEVAKIINTIAPEHLELNIKKYNVLNVKNIWILYFVFRYYRKTIIINMKKFYAIPYYFLIIYKIKM